MDSEEGLRFDVAETLTTMVEGDDVNFDPIEAENEIWKKIKLENFANDTPEDIHKFVNDLPSDQFVLLVQNLVKEGHLST
jgi:hypothetical protein